jgi:hypothetical protein
MATYNDKNSSSDNGKPKHSVSRVLQKFALSAGLDPEENTLVYYEWDKKRFPKWNKSLTQPVRPYFHVGYDKCKREWYLSYIVDVRNIVHGTIDDITGSTSLTRN